MTELEKIQLELQLAHRDCLTLALRLFSESDIGPEVAAVMDRWNPVVESLLAGNTIEQALEELQ